MSAATGSRLAWLARMLCWLAVMVAWLARILLSLAWFSRMFFWLARISRWLTRTSSAAIGGLLLGTQGIDSGAQRRAPQQKQVEKHETASGRPTCGRGQGSTGPPRRRSAQGTRAQPQRAP